MDSSTSLALPVTLARLGTDHSADVSTTDGEPADTSLEYGVMSHTPALMDSPPERDVSVLDADSHPMARSSPALTRHVPSSITVTEMDLVLIDATRPFFVTPLTSNSTI